MRPHWITWLVFTFIVGQVMALIGMGIWIGSEEQNFMNALLGFTAHEYTDSVLGNIQATVLNVVGGTWGFFTHALPKMLMWDYPFLDGGWAMAKWFILYPVSAGTVLGIISVFKR